MKFEKGDKKIIRAWTMYDWANSVYPLVITTAIFPLFYKAQTDDIVSFMGYNISNISLYSYTLAASLLVIFFTSPLLSGIADYTGRKKFFMKIFNFIGAFSCMGMFFIEKNGNLWFAMILVFFANIGFWGSLVFYNAFLPEIADKKDHDAISARGFGLGYFGSSLLLIVILALVLAFDDYSIKIMQWGFVVTGIWWIGFALQAYKYLPGEDNGKKITPDTLKKGYRELKKVWIEFSQIPRLSKFLLSFFVYSMALQTVMTMAQFFGTDAIDWGETDMHSGMIITILIIQFIAIPGATVFARLSKLIGNKKALIVALLVWCGISTTSYWVTSPYGFYALGVCVGFVMGGSQSLSRSTYSKLLPETEDTASYFSFYDVLEKLGLAIGIVSFGYIEDHFDIRISIVGLTFFFVVGLILLLRLPELKDGDEGELID